MYVLSVKGSNKGHKSFWYVSAADGKLSLVFTPSIEYATNFDSVDKCRDYAKEHYMELLVAMLNAPARLYPDTLAIRKINFKTIEFVNLESFKENDNENTNALNESSDNESESESELETEVSDNEAETSSSDIQEDTEQ